MNGSLDLVRLGDAEKLIALSITSDVEAGTPPQPPSDPLYSLHEEE